MDNKVYYGEYSLKHWIDLILKENIILPDYQRHFVWDEEDVLELIKTLKDKQFVPPVIIGAFNIKKKPQNLILDGQQRLTSILLAHLKLCPDRNKYYKPVTQTANENDDEEEDEQPDIIEWTFKTYIDEEKNKQKGYYHELNLKDINDDFFENTFLGFAYLVPANNSDSTAQQKYYSTVFRNINKRGEKLLPQESRKSLYFLDSNLAQFFDPDFCKNITINKTKLDFVRYLSLLSQYYKEKKADNVAKYYGRRMEEYYEEYIYSIVEENDSKIFGDFSAIFPDRKYDTYFELLLKTIKSFAPNQFISIIDSDMYLFGLIYEIVFEKRTIDDINKDDLKRELIEKINTYKNDDSHKKTPSALKHLRPRIDESIAIYKRYAK